MNKEERQTDPIQPPQASQTEGADKERDAYYAGFGKGWEVIYEVFGPKNGDDLKWVHGVIGVDDWWKKYKSTPAKTEGAPTRGGLLEPRSTGYDRVSAPLPGVGGVTGAPDPGPQPLEVPDVNLVPWEIGEKVITVGGKVVGFTLTLHDGEIIRSWLESAIREMWELRAQQREDFPAPQLRARLIQRINENNLLLEQLEAIHGIWLAWRECGAANAIAKASEYMAKVGKVVDPTYPTDRLRKSEEGPRPSGVEASPQSRFDSAVDEQAKKGA